VVEPTMDLQSWLRKQLEQASPDLLRAMVEEFAEALMGAEAEALCGAPYGERSPERVNIRNGYRERAWDTRVGRSSLRSPSSGRAATDESQVVAGRLGAPLRESEAARATASERAGSGACPCRAAKDARPGAAPAPLLACCCQSLTSRR